MSGRDGEENGGENGEELGRHGRCWKFHGLNGRNKAVKLKRLGGSGVCRLFGGF